MSGLPIYMILMRIIRVIETIVEIRKEIDL